MKTSEVRLKLRIHEEAERIHVGADLHQRLQRRLSNQKPVKVRALTLATAGVLAALLIGAGTVAVSSRRATAPGGSAASAAPPRPTGVYRSIPLPGDLHVIPPAQDLPKPLKDFSGVWQGTGDARLPLVFVVEAINSKTVEAVYAWATNGVITRPGWSRLVANVQSANTVGWSNVVPASQARVVCGSGPCNLRFTYTISADGKSLFGRRQTQFSSGGFENDVTLHHPSGGSAPQSSSRMLLWIVVGVVAAAIFAGGGFWLGRAGTRGSRRA